MTKIYIAKDSDRLDTIVYNHYGHLRFFEQVLTLNPKLAATLKAGDKVFLPEIKRKPRSKISYGKASKFQARSKR